MAVRIYRIDRATEIWIWLCERAVAARVALGWSVKETREPPHEYLKCQDRDEHGCCSTTTTNTNETGGGS